MLSLLAECGTSTPTAWKANTTHVMDQENTIEALRRAEQKYRSIFEHATEGIFQTTPDGQYLSANPALARMYGYDSPEKLLAALTDIGRQLYVQPGRRSEFTFTMRQNGRVLDFESEIYRRDGSIIWISENARAVHDEVTSELLYYEGMVQDITRRKRAEDELRAKNAQLEADLEMARDIQQVFLPRKYPVSHKDYGWKKVGSTSAIGISRRNAWAAISFASCRCRTWKPAFLFATFSVTDCGRRW
ncbi:MAG: PAS domain S-box protein [Verrucomicrobia bacterium]|nr:PAS domain S-box protein [Verrucomicrobiota bacterium]